MRSAIVACPGICVDAARSETVSGNWVSVVYLLDVSQSVSPQAISEAIDWIEETEAVGNPDHSRFIPFASNSLVFEELDELRTVQVTSIPTDGAIDQSATDIERALTQASRSFAPNHLKRLVLLSDGGENAGEVKDSILRMNQEKRPGLHATDRCPGWFRRVGRRRPGARNGHRGRIVSARSSRPQSDSNERRGGSPLRDRRTRNTRGRAGNWNQPSLFRNPTHRYRPGDDRSGSKNRWRPFPGQ